MRATTPTYLVNKTRLKQKALTLRIPQDVHDGLNAVRERANRAGFVFDIQAVVVDALERAVARVSGELIAVEGEQTDNAPAELEVRTTRRSRKPARVEVAPVSVNMLQNDR